MQATAHISYVYNFTPLIVEYDNLKSQRPNVAFSSYRYIDYSQNRSVITDSIIKRFPVVIRGDGTPWDLANLYLIHRFNVISQSDIASMLTIRNNANSLLDYLKFIESMKNKNAKYDEFYFPEDARMRILNLYRIFLKKRHERASGLDGIEISTAKGLLNNIINFYRTIISNGLIEPGKIKNIPFVESTVNVRMVGHNGQVYTKTTKTTDLSIRGKTHPLPSNLIKDQGNRVRPMSNKDERLMIEKLFEIGSRKYQLFILFALYTGARIQTIGTLRIKNIKQALKNSTLNSPEIDMKVGPGTTIDTKGDARYRLKIPRPLVNDLINYVNSSYAKDIRKKSFYGDTDENYVFLTDGRSPSAYYTSKKEMVDRTNSIYSRRLTAKDRLDFQPSLGGTIRQFINKLNRHCLAEDSDFQEFHCHDLRATYGMNFIDAAYESGRMNGSADDATRSKQFNDNTPSPRCGAPLTCFFCENFGLHADIEDVIRLLTVSKWLGYQAKYASKNIDEYFTKYGPIISRINEIIESLWRISPKLITSAMNEFEQGRMDPFWAEKIDEILSQELFS